MTAPYVPAATSPYPPSVDVSELGPGVFTYWAKRWSKWRLFSGWFMIVISLVSIILSPLAILFGVMLFRSPNFSRKARAKRIDLHQHGIALHEEQGLVAAYRFDQISVAQRITENYYNGFKTGTAYLLTVTGADGRSSKITQFYDNIGHLAQALQQGVMDAQFGRAVATAQAGYPVTFGPFTVTPQGLVCGQKHTVTWPLLDRVVVSSGTVRIMVHGRRTALVAKPIHEIPNFALFLALVSNVRATQG
ncbi:DUF6585 family protein [Streptacidiphilus jiangxiensis]|uniref:Uncharacterized protein n=1 Tax=Streptacidiphilus jiangxiensis TaxID=235985 RepID=A0A1H7U9I8_STRJI|nr:DUF6585 family protein [Streptacidiphilus jiangxiensis]SEL93358.1 hypothetical protein SAMN05414137_115142 [Streptacidiphilus jiangxiensis]